MMKKIMIFFLTSFFLVSISAQAATMVVVTRKDTVVNTITYDELTRIFLGKKTTWKDGTKIVPVCLKGGKNHDLFLRKFLDMNAYQFDIYWKRAVFTGTGRPPVSFVSERDAKSHVANTVGAIGYINSELADDTLKIIHIK